MKWMNEYNTDEVVSIGSWIGITILLAIPFVNIITILYLAFGSSNENLRNYGKATLIIFVIGIVIALLFVSCSAMMF